MHSIDNSEYVEETMRIEKEKWRRKKIDYLRYEARFWYVKTLDLADFKYVIIYT